MDANISKMFQWCSIEQSDFTLMEIFKEMSSTEKIMSELLENLPY